MVQAIHSSVLTSMMSPMIGVSGLATSKALGLGGGARLREEVVEPIELGVIGSPSVLRDRGVEPVSVMTLVS